MRVKTLWATPVSNSVVSRYVRTIYNKMKSVMRFRAFGRLNLWPATNFEYLFHLNILFLLNHDMIRTNRAQAVSLN